MHSGMKSLLVSTLAILAIASPASAGGLQFKRTEVGFAAHSYFFGGGTVSSTHYKLKTAIDLPGNSLELEGRLGVDSLFGPVLYQGHLTLGASVSPNTKLGLSVGQIGFTGGTPINQIAVSGMHQFGNGAFLDLSVGQLTVTGSTPLNFAVVKYSQGNWFVNVTNMAIFGANIGSASIGYTHNLGPAAISASVGAVYSSTGGPSIGQVAVELKIPFGQESSVSTKKSSQGTDGVENRSFEDFNYAESVFGGAV